MVVKRIVADIEAGAVHQVSKFYSELFDLKVAMDQGWIVTQASRLHSLIPNHHRQIQEVTKKASRDAGPYSGHIRVNHRLCLKI